MKILAPISFTKVMQEWLRVEWYNSRFDGVRKFINPKQLSPLQDALLIKTLFYIERHTILTGIQLENTTWHVARMDAEEFENIERIGGGGWEHEFGSLNITIGNCVGAAKNKLFDINSGIPDLHCRKIMDLLISIGKRKIPDTVIIINRKDAKAYKMLEGNHRAIAWLLAEKMYKMKLLPKKIIIGIEK